MPKKKKAKSTAARPAAPSLEEAANKPDPDLEPPPYHRVLESYDPRTGIGKKGAPPAKP